MAQNLLTVGTGEASSDDFVLDAQSEATIGIRGKSGIILAYSIIYIELKDDTGNYVTINILNSNQKTITLTGIGTYRVRRPSSSTEIGVFYEIGSSGGSSGGTNTTSGLTDAQLRANAVPISGTVAVNNFPTTQPVSGPLTNSQLRAAPLTIEINAPINVTSTVYANSIVLKNTGGILYGLSGFNSKTSDQFILICDTSSVPPDNTAPKLIIKVGAESTFNLDFGMRGRAFTTGIVVCNSSTGPVKTIGAADCWFDGQVS